MPLNVPQRLFLEQDRSDYEIFRLLGRRNPCHRLHYLQMCTEKLAKVYFWRNGNSPGLGHHKFGPFLRDLDASRPVDFHEMFGYKNSGRFLARRPSIFNLAERIQNLVPAGGNTGPNPEYPWPPSLPAISPLTYTFPEWQDWNESVAGHRLRRFVENLLGDYPAYFP